MPNQNSIGIAYTDQVINGGTIDNTVIGGTTKAAGSFTTVTSTGAVTGTTVSGTGTVTAISGTAITAGGSAALLATSTASFGVFLGSGAPTIAAAKGSLYLTRGTLFTHIATREATQAMADDLFAVVQSGAVKIRIDQRYPLADVSRAHTDLEARNTTGCSVLLP